MPAAPSAPWSGVARTELASPPEPPDGISGVQGEYFEGADLDQLLVERIDDVVEFDWADGSPAALVESDYFSARWRALVPVPRTGAYRFFTTTDDGVRLWGNGQLIIDRWIPQVGENLGTIDLVRGQTVEVRLDYFEEEGAAFARLEWQPPGEPRQLLRNVLEPPPMPDAFSRFVDTEIEIGAGKAAWGDFDKDGRVDILAGGDVRRNDGDGFSFFARVGDGIWGDYDNDGWLDIFVYQSRSLFRNDEGRPFVNVTSQVLPELPTRVSVGAAWPDLVGDAYLDLYIGGYENPSYDVDVIQMNEGGERFRLAWTQSVDIDPARGFTACDFGEDFDVDDYVSNYRLEQNQLWRNRSDASFVNVAPSHGVEGIYDGWGHSHGHTIGSAWGDLDADGHFDLFVGNFSRSPAWQDRPAFYRNLGPSEDYRFEDLSEQAGLAWQESFASPTLGDVDNDGDLDLATNGRLYRNEGNDNDWIALSLVGDGVDVNRAAIGAQARVVVRSGTITRQVESSTGEGHQNDLELHFGLGVVADDADDAETVSVEIRWPNGDVESRLVALNRSTEIVYGMRRFVRGDINADGRVDVSDAVALLLWLFRENPTPRCVASANTDGDSVVVLTDAVYLLDHLFGVGPAPASPYPDGGASDLESDEALGCAETSYP